MNRITHIERDFVLKRLEDDGTFEGYASVFGVEDHHGETVVKGAFQKCLAAGRKIRMFWQHDRDQPIGIYKDAREDDHGLYVKGKLTRGVQKADEAYLLMQDEAVDSMSIGAYVIKDRITDHKRMKRDFLELDLREISVVTIPALDAARITSVKSLSDVGDIPELEAYLRDVGGFSVKEAKTIISKAKAGTRQRDVDDKAIQQLQQAINNLRG